MGAYVIRMPDIGEGIAEVEIAAWRVKPGDTIAEDDVVADVMTDKATVEIPSPVSGVVLALGGEAGLLMAVGAELLRLEVDGPGNLREGAAAPAAPVNTAPVAAVPVAVERTPVEPAPVPPARPAVAHAAARLPLSASDKPLASPAVRQYALDRGVNLRFVQGSGPAGRILRDDVDACIAGVRPAGAGTSGRALRPDTDVPVIGLRRKIAQKMQESKRRIPHFSYVEEVDVTELEALRLELNTRFAAQRGKLTLLPLLARAVVMATDQFPQMNARFDDDNGVVTRYGAVHLGIATQTPAGLVVPVVRDAQARTLWDFAQELSRVAELARTAKAGRDELSGSTLTLSSLGALGGIVTTPVINHPEVAIIGVNRMVERPVIRRGSVVARQMMNLSSSFDHRVVDGMDAAGFIQAIRAALESPAMLFVE